MNIYKAIRHKAPGPTDEIQFCVQPSYRLVDRGSEVGWVVGISWHKLCSSMGWCSRRGRIYRSWALRLAVYPTFCICEALLLVDLLVGVWIRAVIWSNTLCNSGIGFFCPADTNFALYATIYRLVHPGSKPWSEMSCWVLVAQVTLFYWSKFLHGWDL